MGYQTWFLKKFSFLSAFISAKKKIYQDSSFLGMILFHDGPQCNLSPQTMGVVLNMYVRVVVFQSHTFLNMVPSPSRYSILHPLKSYSKVYYLRTLFSV